MGIQTGTILAESYEIAESLGKGGLARTYAAVRLEDRLPVVIKELRFAQLENWKPYELFEREVRVLKQLDHPAIPRCLEAFSQGEGDALCHYLVLERVPGQSLAQKLNEGWRPQEAAVKELALKVLDVLEYLHGLAPPVIHRDIKPSNLVIDGENLYLVDFGAVQDLLRPEGSSTVVGTFGYMAPEQLTGRALPASDLYALWATLVSILSGRTPAELPQRELKLDFRPYVNATPELVAWLEKLLEPAWEHRFASAAEARRALLEPSAPSQHLAPVRKPAGTRVELLRQPESLYIRIPPGNFSPQTIYLTFFSVIWLSFVAFWTILALRGSIFFAMFSIPFWLVGLVMARTVAHSLFLSTIIELTPSGYQVRSRLGNLYQRGVSGELADISGLGPNLRYRLNNTPVFALGLEAGTRTHYFGTQLSHSEQQWLQAEIMAYLTQTLPPAQLKYLHQTNQIEY